MKKRSLMASALFTLAGLCAGLAAPAQAQTNWPTKPIKLVVPYPPGGPVDLLARTIAPRLGEVLGQAVTVDNRAGASGIIGMDSVHRAEPDGYTFGIGVPGGITVLPTCRRCRTTWTRSTTSPCWRAFRRCAAWARTCRPRPCRS